MTGIRDGRGTGLGTDTTHRNAAGQQNMPEVHALTESIELLHRTPGRRRLQTNRLTAIAVVTCAGMLAASMLTGCGTPAGAQSGANTAPTILAVTVTPERIQPGDRVILECEATDEDGDTLRYTWSAGQGALSGTGAAVEWVAPGAEGLYRISVSVDDGRGGTDQRSASLAVKSNSAPTFQSIASFPQGVRPGAAVSISCPAADADGDEVTYEWRAAFGEIRGEGDTITWIAPTNLGSYVVNVVARDPFGAESRRDVLISVTPSLTPKLGEFTVEAIGHDMLKYELGVWDIYIGESCRIECVVLEGDGPFAYDWSVDKGTLTADGASATWQAPGTRGPATIKVAVTDAHGNTNSGQLLMYAEDCTCAFD